MCVGNGVDGQKVEKFHFIALAKAVVGHFGILFKPSLHHQYYSSRLV